MSEKTFTVRAFDATFTRSWSPYAGAIMILLLCLGLMQQGLFWGVFGGLKLWGDHLNSFIGLAPLLGISDDLPDPFMHRISLMNIVLFIGALSAALISRQFRINRPPPLEYVWGAGGGIFMGLGSTLAGGCTVGGFLTPAMFSSPAGWTMWAGLLVGVVVGLKLLFWTFEHVTWGMTAPAARSRRPLLPYFPVIGWLLMAAVFAWSVTWALSDDRFESNRAFLLAAVFLIGFAMHRSRFCVSRSLREPFMTAEGEMSKAVMLLLLLGIPAGSLFLQQGNVDPYLAIPATFWLGSLVGGILFGVGMIFAGGCASGSIWRAAEGNLKLVVVLFFFAWSGSLFCAIFDRLGIMTPDYDIDFMDGIPEITAVGFQAYFPDIFNGWAVAYILPLILIIIWYLLVNYNEKKKHYTVV
jgi:uncharacterized membrane protein YedE/YeeE